MRSCCVQDVPALPGDEREVMQARISFDVGA
jgi:hypothetical protein